MTEQGAKLKSLTLTETATVKEALAAIDRGERQIALIVDGVGRLLATVTDGDIRRGLLRGVRLDAPVSDVMQTIFTSIAEDTGREVALALMQAKGLHQLPVVDSGGRIVDLVVIDDVSTKVCRNTHVILMAGGLGTRLRPLTETVPKPMLPVGGKPILELILRNLTDQGFFDFTISLNFRGEMIRDYFGDGARFNAQIDYVEENKRMGTAGALSLLKTRPESPFIVMNGDLLTAVPFEALVRFHHETESVATMSARDHLIQVPYGVIEVENTMLKRIVEKPTYSYFVNAGIYVLSPEVLDYIAPDEYLDMPILFERFMGSGARASVFPIQEYWMDIGRPEDLQKARKEYIDMIGAAPIGESEDD